MLMHPNLKLCVKDCGPTSLRLSQTVMFFSGPSGGL